VFFFFRETSMDTRPEQTPVDLVPHRREWAEMARVEAARLTCAIGPEIVVGIHHIGSTSIPGIHAKPTIDLMPLVTTLREFDMREAAVRTLGYEWRGEFGIPGRRFLTMMAANRASAFSMSTASRARYRTSIVISRSATICGRIPNAPEPMKRRSFVRAICSRTTHSPIRRRRDLGSSQRNARGLHGTASVKLSALRQP